MSVTIIVGGQYGSEGKGKIAAHIAADFSLAVRTGGPNAGHTVEHNGQRFALQSIPCAFVNPDCHLAIGAGGIIETDLLLTEMALCGVNDDRLTIDPQATVILPEYVADEREIVNLIGSTGKGVGAAVAAKVARKHVMLARDVAALSHLIGDVAALAHTTLRMGHKVCLEGTQGFGLSLHHGTYPYVTSRDTTAGGLCGEAGVGPLDVSHVIMVVRTYPIRVAGNSGPMGDEISWDTVRQASGSPVAILERTTVTRKVRRVARFDVDQVRIAAEVNSASEIALNFADYIDYNDRGVREFDMLSPATRRFIDRIERDVNVPITLIGTGPESGSIVDRRARRSADGTLT